MVWALYINTREITRDYQMAIEALKFNNLNLASNPIANKALESDNTPVFGNALIGGAEDTFASDATQKQVELQAQELVRLVKGLNPENKDSIMKKVVENKIKALKELAEATGIDLNEVFSEVMANMSRNDQKKVSKALKVKISKVQPKVEETETQPAMANPFGNTALFSGFASQEMNFAPSYANTPKVKLDKEFLNKVKDISGKLNCSHEDLLAVMNSESGLNSRAVNRKGGATGLIQFMPSTARALGTSTAELYNMTPTQQLKYVEKYLTQAKASARMGNRKLTGADLYSLVFMPGKANGEVMCSAGSKEYSWNSGLDRNRDGQITKSDLGSFIASKRVNEEKVFS